MATDLAKLAKERRIRYFLISYVDLFGALRAKLVPARAIGEMQKAGAGFAGFATWLDMSPADSDMFAVPDPDSLVQLPWKPEVGWLASDLFMDGKPVAHGPRHILRQQVAAAAACCKVMPRVAQHSSASGGRPGTARNMPITAVRVSSITTRGLVSS